MAASAERVESGTAERILDVAEELVQVRGFNGFSYADIASGLGITKAALHYHYAAKADLGEALIKRYADRFARALARIEDLPGTANLKLAGYADLYLGVLNDQRMCLCGMLAADYQTLPQPMRTAVLAFFDHNEDWLARIVQQGQRDGSLSCAGSPDDLARMIISTLEGAMLIARGYGDVARFQAAVDSLLERLVAAPLPEAGA